MYYIQLVIHKYSETTEPIYTLKLNGNSFALHDKVKSVIVIIYASVKLNKSTILHLSSTVTIGLNLTMPINNPINLHLNRKTIPYLISHL